MEPICSLKKIIKKNGKEIVICDDIRSHLLEELQNIQDKEGYVSDENMQNIAEKFNIHPVEVYSVVSFYSFLSTEKKGDHIIRISNCQPCKMKGSDEIEREFENILGIKCGETTSDGKYTLEKTSCIGMCDKAPAIMVDDKLMGPVAVEDVNNILNQINI